MFWNVFSVYVVLFGACLTHLIGLSFVWRVFGVRLAFVALFVSRKVFIVVDCVRLQWIAIDFMRLRFCRSVCRFFIVLVSTLLLFSRPVWYIVKLLVCVMTRFCCTCVAVHRQHFYRWRIATNESSYRGSTSKITLMSWKWSTRASTYMAVCMISVTVFSA